MKEKETGLPGSKNKKAKFGRKQFQKGQAKQNIFFNRNNGVVLKNATLKWVLWRVFEVYNFVNSLYLDS